MPQCLTNYDAEIICGVLRLPPNCARLTKGERRKVKRLATDRAFLTQGFAWKALVTKIPVLRRKGNRPDVTVWITVVTEEKP